MADFSKADIKWMRAALSMARRGLGLVSPNPSVGCMLIKDGIVIGRGVTQAGGRPHAETVALMQAGDSAEGSTAYVTLEPCAHFGKTPPCAQALIDAKVARVVIAVVDTDPRVAGSGVKMLQNASIEVCCGVFESEAKLLNSGFFSVLSESCPEFTLKIATSLDGKIALENGESKWITGSMARQYGHMLRAQHDAILVGVNTVIIDNPTLDCRLDGLEDRSPIRIILDSSYRTPLGSKLLSRAEIIPVIIVGEERNQSSDLLEKAGAKIISISDVRDMKAIASALAGIGLRRILVEGGGQIYASFLKAGLCDNLYHFKAGKILGAEAKNGIGELELAQLAFAPHLMPKQSIMLGDDTLTIYQKPE